MAYGNYFGYLSHSSTHDTSFEKKTLDENAKPYNFTTLNELYSILQGIKQKEPNFKNVIVGYISTEAFNERITGTEWVNGLESEMKKFIADVPKNLGISITRFSNYCSIFVALDVSDGTIFVENPKTAGMPGEIHGIKTHINSLTKPKEYERE